MTDKIYFAIALHFHQPIGNFDKIFERAYNCCYKPLLETLSDYPDLKVVIHISGCLLDYLDKNHPDTISLLKDMISCGQLEIMAGGYYEPILTAIPAKDAIGQIDMMLEYIKKKFNFKPSGMWVAERVWSPELADVIYKAGMRYIILDDAHLLRSGVKSENMHGYFLTGKGKEKIAVFPSDKQLRYRIPFKLPHETIDYFKNIHASKRALLFTYGDDAEKFGEWPGTHKWVFQDRWLRNFLEALRHNKQWLELVHFKDYLKKSKPTQSLEIKQGSYEEMMEWSQGKWLNFLTKYPETKKMHNKMLYVSSKLENARKLSKNKNAPALKEAAKELYKGQCNCGWWHGVFGGLYLYHLRAAIYNHLIKADIILDGLMQKDKKSVTTIKEQDFDSDGKMEAVIENKAFSIYVDPAEGGVIKELDCKSACFNIVNGLSRKPEQYHQKIINSAQGAGDKKVVTIHDDFRIVDPHLKEKLIYDKFSRDFLRSYFVKKDLNLKDFISSSYDELGDFSEGFYALSKEKETIALERESDISGEVVSLVKTVGIKSANEIKISCSINKKGRNPLNALFGLEFNVTMPDLDSDRYFYSPCPCAEDKGMHAQGEAYGVSGFSIKDSRKELGVCFNFTKNPAKVLYFPVKTVSQSERAYELNYQCSCLFFLWDMAALSAKEAFKFNVNFILEK